MHVSKADGIYITERMADKLKEHFPQHHEQIDRYKNNVLLTNKSLVVNKEDYVKEKIDRAFVIGKPAKTLYTMCHLRVDKLSSIQWDKHLHGLDFKSDSQGNVQVINKRTGTDLTKFCQNFIKDTERELNELYKEIQKEVTTVTSFLCKFIKSY